MRGTGEISRVFPRTMETHAWRPRVTCFSMREDREKLGTRNNATWRKRRIAFSEDYVLCHQLPNKSGIFDLNCLPKMLSLALWCLFATKVLTAPAKTENGEPNWCNMLKVRYLLNWLSSMEGEHQLLQLKCMRTFTLVKLPFLHDSKM